MTTILILTIDDDGRTRLRKPYVTDDSDLPFSEPVTPVRSGDDRGHYDVFEVAGVSIDVMRVTHANPKRGFMNEYVEICAHNGVRRKLFIPTRSPLVTQESVVLVEDNAEYAFRLEMCVSCRVVLVGSSAIRS